MNEYLLKIRTNDDSILDFILVDLINRISYIGMSGIKNMKMPYDEKNNLKNDILIRITKEQFNKFLNISFVDVYNANIKDFLIKNELEAYAI